MGRADLLQVCRNAGLTGREGEGKGRLLEKCWLAKLRLGEGGESWVRLAQDPSKPPALSPPAQEEA